MTCLLRVCNHADRPHVYAHIHACVHVYGVPNVSKTLTNAIFVYPPLIYKYDADLAKYLSDLYIWPRYIISGLDL